MLCNLVLIFWLIITKRWACTNEAKHENKDSPFSPPKYMNFERRSNWFPFTRLNYALFDEVDNWMGDQLERKKNLGSVLFSVYSFEESGWSSGHQLQLPALRSLCVG